MKCGTLKAIVKIDSKQLKKDLRKAKIQLFFMGFKRFLKRKAFLRKLKQASLRGNKAGKKLRSKL